MAFRSPRAARVRPHAASATPTEPDSPDPTDEAAPFPAPAHLGGEREPLLRIRGLRRSFQVSGEPLHVLVDCSMDVQRGEVVAIVGESGSGKSTLLNLLGLLDTANGGEHIFDGVDVTRLREGQRARLRNNGIGFVFQQFHLLERRSAMANVAVPLVLGGVPLIRRRAIAKQLLTSLGLGHRLHAQPHQLSGGEQQRVALARAMCLNPSLILADEPTGALDATTSELIMDQLLEQARHRGAAVIVVTHEPSVASRADRTMNIADGRMY
ncbi:ABC transporter ATP-binding protein [Nocardiopsis gilva YIM 90087]|uniref:ABC transporter ATP-binding protein n=1 Tax=Nocardiopsis gilva YIM 90087 TaxID=1235441 RepID=A0A223S3N0_9ACTN|nr:ABC transporter ATP-binding protein [Nocardiopsis gilva]ASU82728.1 ABC transporter ATP-binding protein [Nocardiopsis gilva YIM 90087]